MIDISYVEVAKLELQEGDLLLVRVPPEWTREQQTNAHDAVEQVMRRAGVSVPILIGTTDVEFQVIRKGAAEP